jgi:hypothetical protein
VVSDRTRRRSLKDLNNRAMVPMKLFISLHSVVLVAHGVASTARTPQPSVPNSSVRRTALTLEKSLWLYSVDYPARPGLNRVSFQRHHDRTIAFLPALFRWISKSIGCALPGTEELISEWCQLRLPICCAPSRKLRSITSWVACRDPKKRNVPSYHRGTREGGICDT